MAAGAIPPPLFFERRRQLGYLPGMAFSQNTSNTACVDHSVERPARLSPTRSKPSGHRPKDI
jgi:hypothetical protein